MFDFPNAPTSGQTATNGSLSYRWDGSKWTNNVSSTSTKLTVGDAAPTSPRVGDLWFDSVGVQLYVRYDDLSSVQWVPANNMAQQDPAVNAQVQNNVGRNLLHNALYRVQQRGAGPWTTSVYTADRWASVTSLDTVSFQITTMADSQRAQIGDEDATNCMSNTFTGNAGAGSLNYITQKIENIRRLAGKTVTVSFWAAASGTQKLGVNLAQVFGSGGSPSANVWGTAQAIQLSTSWARYSATFTLPSAAGKTFGTNADDSTWVTFWYSCGTTNAALAGNIGVQSGLVQLWGVQLEIGTVATPLEKVDPGEDLRRCQRFYYNFPTITAGGATANGATQYIFYAFPVTMRAMPTVNVSMSGGVGWASPNSQPQITGTSIYFTANAASFVANVGFTASADL